MFVYELDDYIDFWTGWLKPDDIFRVRALSCADGTFFDAEEWYTAWQQAQAGAKQLGWEGDCSQGPYVAPLPAPDKEGRGRFVIGFKQSNNGTTFLASPDQLPQLGSRYALVAQPMLKIVSA